MIYLTFKSTWFWLYVENANGCKDYDSLYVIVGSQPVDAFSPNGDGLTTIGLLKILISLVVIKYKYTIDGENLFLKIVVLLIVGMEKLMVKMHQLEHIIT